MKPSFLFFLGLISISSFAILPEGPKTNFTVQPFTPAFVESKGQFDMYDVDFGKSNFKRPSYGSKLGNSIILFNGNSIQFVQKVKTNEEEVEKEEIEKQEPEFELQRQIISFPGANPDAELIVENPMTDYYTYVDQQEKNKTIKASAWKQLLIRNLYPGIDLSYNYQMSGLKYSFIVHAGADPSSIKMEWTGVANLYKDISGSILINSPNGYYTDSAPIAFYADDHENVLTDFFLSQNTVSFSIESYDRTRTLIIDPWITNPSFVNFNSGYDIQHDPFGNVYVYGGANPYELKKYSPAGVPLWTYTTNAQGYYGDFTLDSLGNAYCIYGPWTNECLKLDTAGNVVWYSVNPNHAQYVETYRIRQNPATGLLNVIGMERLTGFNPIAETYDPANGAYSGYYYHPTCTIGETRALTIDSNGDLYALIFSAGGPFSFSNLLWKMDASFNTLVTVNSGYMLGELEQSYTDTWYSGFNGMAVNAYALYTYDGEVVKKWNKNTLALLDSVVIPGGIHYITGGICTDDCGNIYVGGPNSIIQYDSTLTFITSVATTGNVHDVNLGALPGEILACGVGFAGSFNFPVCLGAIPIAIFTAPNHICPGTCTDFINQSSNGQTFLWYFAGATPATSTDISPTNICYNTPGSYSVTLIATNALGSDTLYLNNFITVYPHPPPQGILQSGDTLIANAGAVTYQWYNDGNLIPGATEYYYVATVSGSYNVVATDVNGCEVEAAIFDVIAGISPHSLREELGVRLYPNPVTGTLYITGFSASDDAIEISIYNVLGEKIWDMDGSVMKGDKMMEVDCSAFPGGMYYVAVDSLGNVSRLKFIRQ